MVINNIVIHLFVIFLFGIVCISIVNAYGIVSDIYDVDSYNLGVGGGEDLDNARSLILAESGAIIYDPSYGGEAYRYPEDIALISLETSPITGGGGGGSSGGGGSGGGSSDFECTINQDCKVSYSCISRLCVRLFDLRILNFKSPIKREEFLEFEYKISLLEQFEGSVEITYWIEDKNRTRIALGSEIIYFNGTDQIVKPKEIFIPSNLIEGNYEFYLSANTTNTVLEYSQPIFLKISKNKIVVQKPFDWKFWIILSGSVLFALGIAIIYVKRKNEIIYWLSNLFYKILNWFKERGRQFSSWIRNLFS
jgi:hypothetical protein